MAERHYLEQLTRRLADEGKLIEAGWVALRLNAIPLDAPAEQLNDMRLAFMAGAQHLFGSLMTIMDAGSEPTRADIMRVEALDNELRAFCEELKLRVARPGGQA